MTAKVLVLLITVLTGGYANASSLGCSGNELETKINYGEQSAPLIIGHCEDLKVELSWDRTAVLMSTATLQNDIAFSLNETIYKLHWNGKDAGQQFQSFAIRRGQYGGLGYFLVFDGHTYLAEVSDASCATQTSQFVGRRSGEAGLFLPDGKPVNPNTSKCKPYKYSSDYIPGPATEVKSSNTSTSGYYPGNGGY